MQSAWSNVFHMAILGGASYCFKQPIFSDLCFANDFFNWVTVGYAYVSLSTTLLSWNSTSPAKWLAYSAWDTEILLNAICFEIFNSLTFYRSAAIRNANNYVDFITSEDRLLKRSRFTNISRDYFIETFVFKATGWDVMSTRCILNPGYSVFQSVFSLLSSFNVNIVPSAVWRLKANFEYSFGSALFGNQEFYLEYYNNTNLKFATRHYKNMMIIFKMEITNYAANANNVVINDPMTQQMWFGNLNTVDSIIANGDILPVLTYTKGKFLLALGGLVVWTNASNQNGFVANTMYTGLMSSTRKNVVEGEIKKDVTMSKKEKRKLKKELKRINREEQRLKELNEKIQLPMKVQRDESVLTEEKPTKVIKSEINRKEIIKETKTKEYTLKPSLSKNVGFESSDCKKLFSDGKQKGIETISDDRKKGTFGRKEGVNQAVPVTVSDDTNEYVVVPNEYEGTEVFVSEENMQLKITIQRLEDENNKLKIESNQKSVELRDCNYKIDALKSELVEMRDQLNSLHEKLAYNQRSDLKKMKELMYDEIKREIMQESHLMDIDEEEEKHACKPYSKFEDSWDKSSISESSTLKLERNLINYSKDLVEGKELVKGYKSTGLKKVVSKKEREIEVMMQIVEGVKNEPLEHIEENLERKISNLFATHVSAMKDLSCNPDGIAKLLDEPIYSPKGEGFCLHKSLAYLCFKYMLFSESDLIETCIKLDIVNEETTIAQATSLLTELVQRSGYMVCENNQIVSYKMAGVDQISLIFCAIGTHWYFSTSLKTYRGIMSLKWNEITGSEEQSEVNSKLYLEMMRSNESYDQKESEEIFDEVVKIINENNLYLCYKYFYAANNNNNIAKNGLTFDELILSKYILKNIPAGTNKVKCQLVDILKELCNTKLKARVAATLMCILKNSHEVRVACTLVSILNSLAQDYSDWGDILKVLNTNNFLDCLKDNHEEIRKNEMYSDSESLSFNRALNLYKHTLNGRVTEELDIKEEMIKRTEGLLCKEKFAIGPDGLTKSSRLFNEKLKVEMDALLNKISVKTVLSIEDFMKEFYLKIVGGSYFNEEGEGNLKTIKTELYNLNENLKFNKRTSGLTSKYSDLLKKLKNILKYKPRLKTKVHQKTQEQTKARSIFQTTMLHYLCCAYLFVWIEEGINTENIFMNTDSFDNLNRLTNRLAAFKGRYVNSFDFEDFNAQHSFEHMKIVLKSLTDRVARSIVDTNIKLEYLNISEWIINAVDNTYTVVEGKEYKWKNGMPTGIRYTSLMNNLMNYLYSKIMYSGLNCIYKDKPYDFAYCEVCGDDSWHAFISEDHSNIFNYAMLECGYSIQMSKQMTSKNMFEFLRLQYYSNGLIAGCLNRTISNAVCGNWEDDGIEDPFGIFSEIYSTMISMLRRGMISSLVKKFFVISLTNTFNYRYYDLNDFVTFEKGYKESKSFAEFFDLIRLIPIESGGLSSLFYNETYLAIGQISNEVRDIIKKLKKIVEMEQEDRKSFDTQSLKDFRSSIYNWVTSKIGNIKEGEVDFYRLQNNVFKLATEGAWKKDTSNNPIERILKNGKLLDQIRLVNSKLIKRSFMPKISLTKGRMSLLLISDPSIYQMYYNSINMVGIVQSMSAANLDIVKFWLVNSALKTSRRNELFKKIFRFKASQERLNLVTSVKINSKGKFERLYPSQPTMKLRVMADTESILNACYAVSKAGNLYECILIKEFKIRVVQLTLRN